MRHGVGDVGGVPVDDGGDDEIQPRGPELLRLGTTVGNSALLVISASVVYLASASSLGS